MYLYALQDRTHSIPQTFISLSLSPLPLNSLQFSSFATNQLGGHLQDDFREPGMETPSMQRERKSSTKLGFAQPIRAVLNFVLPVTVFIIILSYPYWPPCPLVKNLSHPLFNSLPPLLDRKFMFLLCNVILIFLSGAFRSPEDQKSPWKKMLDVYVEYIIKKHWFSMTQERSIVERPKLPAIEKGFQRTSADVKEKKKEDSRRESEAEVAAGGGEGQSVLDGLEREEVEEQFIEEDRKFDEFIARGYENWKREHQLLNSKE